MCHGANPMITYGCKYRYKAITLAKYNCIYTGNFSQDWLLVLVARGGKWNCSTTRYLLMFWLHNINNTKNINISQQISDPKNINSNLYWFLADIHYKSLTNFNKSILFFWKQNLIHSMLMSINIYTHLKITPNSGWQWAFAKLRLRMKSLGKRI